MSGRVYRRCACRDPETGQQVGALCPQLAADSKHGNWAFAVYVLRSEGERKLLRRSGFPTRRAAQTALKGVNERASSSVKNDDRETVEEYLTAWLVDKKRTLKPLTHHGYSEYVTKRIVPAIGSRRLEALRHEHVGQFVAELERQGRGAATITRILAVLRSALGDAVRTKRLSHNPAEHIRATPAERTEIQPWTTQQAIAFLNHVTGAPPWQPDPLAPLFETIIGTGLRRGEALALQWDDVDLGARTMRVRRAVTDVAGKLVVGAPKTKGSAAGVGLSARVVRALELQQEQQRRDRAKWGEGYDEQGLVFAREDGAMLRPERVLRRFRALSDEAGLPQCRLHDLRHLAATLMLTNGVPLALVSKTLRHSQVSITADLYGHLTAEAAHAAADALGTALDVAAAEVQAEQSARRKTTSRPHPVVEAI